MPVTLPSGLTLMLDGSHIMEPDRNWFTAPDNYFWYMTPAEETLPPFTRDDSFFRRPETAPVPQSSEGVELYIAVVIGLTDGMVYWRGDMLSGFPKYGMLSKEDDDVWREWLNTNEVKEFLDRMVIRCQTQAEVNKEAIGYAVMTNISENKDGEQVGSKYIDNPLKNSN